MMNQVNTKRKQKHETYNSLIYGTSCVILDTISLLYGAKYYRLISLEPNTSSFIPDLLRAHLG